MISGEFRATPWKDIAAWFAELAQNPDFAPHQYMRDIVASVIVSGVSDRLLATTSMHDIVIVSADARVGLYETIKVASPSSLVRLDEGCMALVFHGRKKRREGRYALRQVPVAEAVPAFWAMVEEKFGIKPL